MAMHSDPITLISGGPMHSVNSNYRLFLEAPQNLQDLDIPSTLVEDLVLRRLYTQGRSSLKALSDALKISFPIAHALFQRLRQQQIFEVMGVEDNDYIFGLTGGGRELAAKRFELSHYSGPAPVSVKRYRDAVCSQVPKLALNRTKLKQALADLVLTDRFLDQLGPAIVSQRSIFLYGPTGNGKTCVAERLTRVHEDAIYVPYAVEFDSPIIVLYDPAVHEQVETKSGKSNIDPRWVLCRRPCILVGGELEPSMLELKLDETNRVYAAPLQMKANNGTLVIDDFGRQIISPQYLLNRWIVPLDRRVDYLTLRYGVKFEIPFETAIVFATNIDPTELADEAFLRRIQNKIYVEPASPEVFDLIFQRRIAAQNLVCDEGSGEVLMRLCQQYGAEELRACYPTDIIDILVSICRYEAQDVVVNKANLERAAALYFTKTMTVGRQEAGTARPAS
jgi:predicted ATPase with chaperone activity